jgi:TPR repeat protein
MRLAVSVAVVLLMPIYGCSDVHVARGLPVLAKNPDGTLIQGAEGLPDLERGNQARLAGRLDDAERDLLPLAQRGYVDAQLYLAAVFGQREALESQDEAIKWYREVLPRRPDAVVPLARVLMRRGDRDSVFEANELLLRSERGLDESAFAAALLDLYSLYPALDTKKRGTGLAERAGKSREIGVRAAAINWYRSAIAEQGNARRLIDLCRKNVEAIPSCFVDLATYYRYARDQKALVALVGRAMQVLQRPDQFMNFDDFYYDPVSLPPIASRMAVALIEQPVAEDQTDVNEDLELAGQAEQNAAIEAGEEAIDDVTAPGAVPQTAETTTPTPSSAPAASPQPPNSGTAQTELADKLLRWMLQQPGAMPVEAAGVAVGFPYLLPDVNIESILQAGEKAKIPRASLFLGQLYYFNQRVPRDAILGEASLLHAVQYRETAAPGHYRLGRLYQIGLLGRPDPQKAADAVLFAARRRVTSADTHLARLFYGTPGTRIDRVNSYVFARLSEDGGVPVVIHTLRGGQTSSYRLLDRLRAELTLEELRKAESLYQRERAVHLVTQPPVSPEVWVKEVR